ncbi:hypothetical protein PSMK_10210 [Phycisphaera mikurensis NBRC 102666]|uniref:Uncharacterized protein n=1 Tax=Phycisphaera mikurensis (strain NBRC 102666 / KCTC 22515 / FYK2301M01) TaxID=1142394 RepID=I0ID42_PHYMF|nr:hypothetical protein PSMK_10210 [Phycisphaera mikurensis NBRC 102666]
MFLHVPKVEASSGGLLCSFDRGRSAVNGFRHTLGGDGEPKSARQDDNGDTKRNTVHGVSISDRYPVSRETAPGGGHHSGSGSEILR